MLEDLQQPMINDEKRSSSIQIGTKRLQQKTVEKRRKKEGTTYRPLHVPVSELHSTERTNLMKVRKVLDLV